jgi:hypothetical protein
LANINCEFVAAHEELEMMKVEEKKRKHMDTSIALGILWEHWTTQSKQKILIAICCKD